MLFPWSMKIFNYKSGKWVDVCFEGSFIKHFQRSSLAKPTCSVFMLTRLDMYTEQPCLHFLLLLEPNPSCLQAWDGVGPDNRPAHSRVKIKSWQPFTLSLTPEVILEPPIPPMHMFSVLKEDRASTQIQGAHANFTQKSCWTHGGIEPGSFLRQC